MAKKQEEKPKKRSGAEALGVYTQDGKHIRTYTEAQTDDRANFVEKAEEFAKKVGGVVKKER